MSTIETVLDRIQDSLTTAEYEAVETDRFELKPCPATSSDWKQIAKSANAFLNTRGGIIILGISEQQEANEKRYVFSGYREDAEPKIKELATRFTDLQGRQLNLANSFPQPEIRDFHTGRIALVYVDELPADEKFCFFEGEAYKRVLTGDHKLLEPEIKEQEEYKQESALQNELRLIDGTSLEDIDLDRLNEYIQLLNQQAKITTLKPSLEAALPFLESNQMVRDGKVTIVGMLVCGKDPGAKLHFRARVQGYLDLPGVVAGDKLARDGNVIQLMEVANTFILRNTRKGVVADEGGQPISEYPTDLLRESVNNAFAHRDYSIDHYVSITVKSGEHIEISNPGNFRPHLLLQDANHSVPVFRIVPEAKARNPKLAHILHLYDKWEGRGRGMSTLVSLCLEDRIDVPFFRVRTQGVSLFLRAGPLVDTRMRSLFTAHNRYLAERLKGNKPTNEQLRVLAYLLKSEELNARLDFTILLTQDNDYFQEIPSLEKAGLIFRHPSSPAIRPIYILDRILASTDYTDSLRATFGTPFDELDETSKELLSAIFRFNNFSSIRFPGARLLAVTLWDQHGEDRGDVRQFDAFDRNVRLRMRRLEKQGLVVRQGGSPRRPGYEINPDFKSPELPGLKSSATHS